MTTYSFMNIAAAIVGPGGAFNLGNGAAVAEEGISVTYEADKDTMTIGADGEVMHSLAAGKAGSCIVRLLKTSPVNAQLNAMYTIQTISSALHGINVIIVRDTARGDVVSCRLAAFKRHPAVTYARVGAMMEWEFNVGKIDVLLGVGTPDA